MDGDNDSSGTWAQPSMCEDKEVRETQTTTVVIVFLYGTE